jgi:hypothetical protein
MQDVQMAGNVLVLLALSFQDNNSHGMTHKVLANYLVHTLQK